MKDKPLFDDFPEISAKAWKQKIQYELKGKDYNEEVVWDSPEGIKVKPFYHADDLKEDSQVVGSARQPWKIGQVIYAGNAIMANEKARKALGKGAEALWFVIPTSNVDIATLLNHIDLNGVRVYLEMQFLSKDYIVSILKKVSNADKLYYQADPIGHLSRSGNWHESLASDFEIFDALTALNLENGVRVDLGLYENAGADMTQQLAYGLAHANEYLNHLNEKGKLDNLKNLQFNVSVGGNYFFEIAKLKALRKLWKVLTDAYGLVMDCHITAIPSKRNKTLYAYNVNMLRTTTECMSAILGGADTIFNLPYDFMYHKDNDFAQRMARNQLLLLKEESYFDKVNDPAAGSYYVETLTNQLAEKALVLFKAIEREGGFLKQLKNHSVQNKIADSAKKQQHRFNQSQDILVGANAYQNELDVMGGHLELYPFVKKNPIKTLITPIIERRLAEQLEQKRLEHE